MLSREENELITKVGSGTPMGNLMRQYWVPALRASKIEADGAPVRVRLFGENFVAFRATDGRVGFFDEACPHRGVSLALGRNEDCAIRCIFHGWKIDVSGQVVEVPSEPAGSNMASKIKVNHYPVHESIGLVWVWLGQGEVPPFPNYEFNNVPLDQVRVVQAQSNCNWLQIIETTIDSSHVALLHQYWLQGDAVQATTPLLAQTLQDRAPTYEIEPTRYGFHAAATRNLANNIRYVRVSEFVAPFISFIPPGQDMPKFTNIVVPVDDEHTIHWFVYHDPEKSINLSPLFYKINFGAEEPDEDNFYNNHGGKDKMWGQDREAMKNGHFTGMYALFVEDFVIGESQGAIADRTKEKLGRSDIAIINARKVLIKAVREFQETREVFGQDPSIAYDQIDAKNLLLEPGEDWHDRLGLARTEQQGVGVA
ncbi:MAG: hypothetical protein JWP00_4223 [Chloroflexi bacterium]|jgi:phthalate 4,5-dioxygenase oxygenase subunit|nr:hypothetical protein [Chloroflexota bacterium]